MPTGAPALTRGLRLLESVAAAGRIGFADLVARCGFPKASTARLLAVLRGDGYLQQDGEYRLGPRCRLLAEEVDAHERLRLVAAPHLAQAAQACDNSVVLFAFREGLMTCLDRVLVEDSVVLQKPGTTRSDLGRGPWGSVIIAHQDVATRETLIAAMSGAEAWWQHAEADRRHLAEHGYIYHDEARPTTLRTLRRLAAPITGPDGRLLGVIGLGGSPDSLPEERIASVAATLVATARTIADDLHPTGDPHE